MAKSRCGDYCDAERIFCTVLQKFEPDFDACSDIWVVYRAFFGIKPPKAQVKLSDRADSSCKTTQKMIATPKGPPTAGHRGRMPRRGSRTLTRPGDSTATRRIRP
mgnify:FL=1